MTTNFRWGGYGNVISQIDGLRQDLNPHYSMSRKAIGGIYDTRFIPDFSYADDIASYSASSLIFNVYNVTAPLTLRHQALYAGGSYTRNIGWSYTKTITLDAGNYMFLAIGAGGGAASTGSNRGGGGGAGGGLAYINCTLTASTTCKIFVGMPGITISSANTSAGCCGGASGIALNGINVLAATGGQGGWGSGASGNGINDISSGGDRLALSYSFAAANVSSTGYSEGGASGGNGGPWYYNGAGGAGGGAAGYSGNGGRGAYGNSNSSGTAGAGGGGGGGGSTTSSCGGGGGVGIYGQGSSGGAPVLGAGGTGGSGGANGTNGNSASDGGTYGGGGGADDDDYTSGLNYNGYGGSGAVVIATQLSGGYPNNFSAPGYEVTNGLTGVNGDPNEVYYSN